jgi:hypothetical protein
MGWQVRAIN